MRPRGLIPLLKWPLTLGLLAALLGGAYLIHRQARQELAREGEEAQSPRRVENGGVKLGARLAASYGILDRAARAASWYDRLVVYGRVVPNPAAAAEVRTAFAGTLRADPKTWPSLGGPVSAAALLGWVDVRLGPQERLDLQARLRESELKLEGARKEVRLQQDRVRSLRTVVSQELISRGEVDLAQVQLTQAETQLATAQAAVELWQKAAEALHNPGTRQDSPWAQPLRSPVAGEVTDLAAVPGMFLEAGALVAKVVDFRRVLVRVDFPPEFLTGSPPRRLDLFAAAAAPQPFAGVHARPDGGKGRPVAAVNPRPASQVDPASQLGGYWYDLNLPPGEETTWWRPGLFVKGLVQVPGALARKALAVPETALLYQQGRPLVYVRTGPGRYERREVQVLGRQGGEWLLAEGVGVEPDEPVVYNNAQVLLSEEFRGEADND